MPDSAAAYVVTLRNRASRQLRRVRNPDHDRITDAIRGLASDPRLGDIKKIRGRLYRLRVGNWRVFYIIDDERRRVTVTEVLRRSEATYRDL